MRVSLSECVCVCYDLANCKVIEHNQYKTVCQHTFIDLIPLLMTTNCSFKELLVFCEKKGHDNRVFFKEQFCRIPARTNVILVKITSNLAWCNLRFQSFDGE